MSATAEAIAPETVYACETGEPMHFQHGWVDKRKFKGALLSEFGDWEEQYDFETRNLVRRKVVHGWAITVVKDEGYCGVGLSTHLLEREPEVVNGHWTEPWSGERYEVQGEVTQATFLDFG